MPIFEYRCTSCDHRFETLVRSSDTPRCPSCESTNLEKQLSVFAVSAHSAPAARYAAPAPCGSCGHPDGPGACRTH